MRKKRSVGEEQEEKSGQRAAIQKGKKCYIVLGMEYAVRSTGTMKGI